MMKSFENVGRELERRGKTAEIRRLAESDSAQRLGRVVDGAAIEKAAKSGDSAALSELLRRVLNTAEGRQLAEDVQKIMKD